MADNTNRFGLNTYSQGDTAWDHTDAVQAIDELAIERGTAANRPDSGDYDDELYLATDQQILYRWDADATDWIVEGVGSETDPLPKVWANEIDANSVRTEDLNTETVRPGSKIDNQDVSGISEFSETYSLSDWSRFLLFVDFYRDVGNEQPLTLEVVGGGGHSYILNDIEGSRASKSLEDEFEIFNPDSSQDFCAGEYVLNRTSNRAVIFGDGSLARGMNGQWLGSGGVSDPHDDEIVIKAGDGEESNLDVVYEIRGVK